MLSLQFVSLLLLGVEEFGLAAVLGRSRQVRSLSGVVFVHVHCEASSDKVQPHLVDCFALVQSDLDSALAGADAFEIVFLDLRRNDMLDISNSLE